MDASGNNQREAGKAEYEDRKAVNHLKIEIEGEIHNE